MHDTDLAARILALPWAVEVIGEVVGGTVQGLAHCRALNSIGTGDTAFHARRRCEAQMAQVIAYRLAHQQAFEWPKPAAGMAPREAAKQRAEIETVKKSVEKFCGCLR